MTYYFIVCAVLTALALPSLLKKSYMLFTYYGVSFHTVFMAVFITVIWAIFSPIIVLFSAIFVMAIRRRLKKWAIMPTEVV